MVFTLESNLISSIGFEKKVTHTKRVWERQRESLFIFKRFLRETKRKPERRNPCKIFQNQEEEEGNEFGDKRTNRVA